ncbi:MAG: hypothetical protein IPF64_16370 [Flavobacteriales bacterium]|nr:hypothetical protein [Flavobacteriales bacterium]
MSRGNTCVASSDTMGVDPSLFTQLVRFQSTFEAMDLHGEAPIGRAMALDAGYYALGRTSSTRSAPSPDSPPRECLVRMRAARRSGSTSMRTARTMIMRRMYIW